MKIGTGITCGRCNEEITQDRGGNMYCRCGKKTRWGYIALGSGKQ